MPTIPDFSQRSGGSKTDTGKGFSLGRVTAAVPWTSQARSTSVFTWFVFTLSPPCLPFFQLPLAPGVALLIDLCVDFRIVLGTSSFFRRSLDACCFYRIAGVISYPGNNPVIVPIDIETRWKGVRSRICATNPDDHFLLTAIQFKNHSWHVSRELTPMAVSRDIGRLCYYKSSCEHGSVLH